jgi:hypothetical protein
MDARGKNGKRITSCDRIVWLANHGRAVVFSGWNKPTSAAFMVGMPLRTVLGFVARGLYEYRKGK